MSDERKLMTVAELIAALQKYPSDMIVVVDGYEGQYDAFQIVERDLVFQPSPSYYGSWAWGPEELEDTIPAIALKRIEFKDEGYIPPR